MNGGRLFMISLFCNILPMKAINIDELYRNLHQSWLVCENHDRWRMFRNLREVLCTSIVQVGTRSAMFVAPRRRRKLEKRVLAYRWQLRVVLPIQPSPTRARLATGTAAFSSTDLLPSPLPPVYRIRRRSGRRCRSESNIKAMLSNERFGHSSFTVTDFFGSLKLFFLLDFKFIASDISSCKLSL